MAGPNYFDRFDIADDADLTKPQGGMAQPRTAAELERARPAPAAPEGGNYFDRFDTGAAPKPAAPKAEEPGWTSWAMNLADRAGLALGVIDPSTYRGRNPDGSLVTAEQAAAKQTTISNQAPRGLGERFMDSAGAMVEHYSPAALVAREIAGRIPNADTYAGTPGADNSQAAQIARAAPLVAANEREFRDQEAMLAAADPAWRDGDNWYSPGTIARAGADFLGGAAGGLVSDPTTVIAPGGSFLTKVLGQAAIGGVADAAVQGGEIAQGVRDTWSPAQTAISAAGGAAIVGGIEAVPAVRRWWAQRGVNVDSVPDEQLVAASLDGTIGGADAAAELRTTLERVGARPEQFSTPEAAAAAAERASAAQGRAPANFEGLPDVGRSRQAQNAFSQALASLQAAHEAGQLPARTLGDDVTIIGAPEGNVRSDDAGALAGLERKRNADSAVLSEAQARVADDPLVAAVLDSDMSPQMKVKALADRIERDTPRDAPIDTNIARVTPEPSDIANAYRAPTPDKAIEPKAGGFMDRVRARESSGDDAARAKTSSATGRYQFTDRTWLGTYRKRFGQDGNSDAQVLAMRGNGALQDTLMRDLTNGNARALRNAGFADDDGNLYLTHFLGEAGGVRVLKADPNTPVINLVGRQAVEANRSILEGKTAADVIAWAHRKMGGRAPEPGPVYRAADYSRAEGAPGDGYTFDPIDAGATLRENSTDNMGAAEKPQTFNERQATEQESGPFATGTSTRPFRAGPEDAEWEARARATADELHAKAMEDLDRRWKEAEAKRQEREANRGADQRFERERTNTEQQAAGDPSAFYRGKYDQKPVKAGEFWATTSEGFVAGKTGAPVAFRNAREAAKWAAGEKLGGDFEFVSYGGQDRTGKQRVSLRRRDGSTYGEPIAPTPAEPPAGRSPDTSQRVLSGPRAETPEVARGSEAVQEGALDTPGPSAPRGGEVMPPDPVAGAKAEALEAGAATTGSTTRGAAPEPDRAATGSIPAAAPPRSPVQPVSREPVTGRAQQVVTARGRPVDTQFEVHELRDLVSSDRPEYDQRLQPRDRSGRSSSDAQVSEIASRLDPARLESSREAAQGAPIIGPDRMVESGNGRVASIRRAYEMHPERVADYRAMIERDHPEAKGFDQPVLVRRRTTSMSDDERAMFTREANERDTMGMSSTEQAKADAGTLPAETLALYRGGAVTDAGNREFVRAWMDRVATPAERNQLMQPDGTLSADGVRRIRSSLLAKAFDDADLVAKVVEDPDTEIRAIGNTLTDAAAGFANLRERVARGELPREYDITPQVAEAANKIATARNQGQKIGDAFRQDDMFGGRADPVTEAVARLMFKDEAMTRPRSAADMADGFRFYLDEAAKHDAVDMFGGGASEARAVDILDAARKRLDQRAGGKQTTMFQRAVEDGFAGRRGNDVPLAGELNRIAGAAKNRHVADLARALEPLVGDLDVRFGPIEKGVRGMVDDFGDGPLQVRVADQRYTDTILHEAIHVATLARWGALADAAADADNFDGKEAVQAFNALFERAKKAYRRHQDIDGNAVNWLENPDEMLAYGLTSPAFQRWLKARNEAGLWGRFVNGVRGLLGLAPRYGTMLDQVLSRGADLLRAAKETEPYDGAVTRKPTTLFSREAGSDERSWGAIGNLVFDREFRSGDAAVATAAIKRTVGDPKGALGAVGDRLRGFGEAVAYSTDSAFRSMSSRLNAPTLTKLADLFHAEAGVTGRATGRTYGEAVARGNGRFLSRMDEALVPHRGNDASMGRIRDLLAQPNKAVRATAEERTAARQVRDLLAEVLEYRRDAGEAIGEVKDGYFPRQLRQDRVFADPDKFLAGAEAAYRQIGADDPKKAAAAYMQRAIDGHLGIADGVGSGSPGASSAKAREFGSAADEHLRDFYETNPLTALTTYMSGAVKRAEEVRRFGAKGREGSAERAAWEKEHGDKTQWDVMRGAIQDELRANGHREPGLLDRIEALRVNSLGRSRMGSPKTGAAISVIHAWNQLSTLGRAMVASVPELSMGFVRAGPRLGFTHLNATMTEFVRNVRKLPASDAARYAEAAGAIGADNALHLLKARADDVTANVATTKLLDQFYRKNGLEAWTRAGRTAAVKTGQRFVAVLADDMATGTARAKSRAAGYLRELGVKDPEAFAAAVRSDTPTVADLAGDSGHAAEYATALLRFANQSVLMPTRSVKPSWASHPIGSLVFALQSYNYAFKKQVLDRVGRETLAGIKERDPAKLAAAAGLVVLTGTTAAVQGLRHAVWGSPVNSDKDTGLHYALETLDRAGMFGAASPLFNAFEGLKYQRTVGQSLQGSVLGRTSDALDAAGGLVTNNNPNTDTQERKAAAAFYDVAVNPAISAIGAGVLRGALGSAAIVGHGVRNDNGVLPADRAAFVDTVGGPEPDSEGDD